MKACPFRAASHANSEMHFDKNKVMMSGHVKDRVACLEDMCALYDEEARICGYLSMGKSLAMAARNIRGW